MGKKQLVYEEPIVPVFIDRDKELQAYYSCVNDLALKDPPRTEHGSYPSQPTAPPGQWPAAANNPYGNYGQGYSYPQQPQVGYPQPAGYPQMPPQQPYPGYAPNSAYTPYPQVPGYPPAPQHPYGAPAGYGGYAQPAMPQAPGGWPGYGQPQPYGGYGQTPQPTSYQATPYPAYPGYQQPANLPGQEHVTAKHTSSEQSGAVEERAPSAPPSGSYPPQGVTQNYGWGDLMFSGYDDQYYRPPSAPMPSYYSGMQPVEETITVSQASRGGYISDDYYAKQFQSLQIGWNV